MTKKIILLSLVLGTTLWASSPEVHHLDRQRDVHHKTSHAMHQKQHHEIKQHKKAIRRTFRTAKEFRHRHHKIRKHMKHVKSLLRGRTYRDRYAYDDYGYNQRYRNHPVRGFRHYRNSWYLAFRYENASFYDNEGFYYGYFNHKGYTFEGEFYRYDRYYTYEDRVRGKGVFTHRYFRPVIRVL